MVENIKQCTYSVILFSFCLSNFGLSMDFVTSNINLKLTDIYKKAVHTTASFTDKDNSIKKIAKPIYM